MSKSNIDPNKGDADFPRREPLAAVEPLGVSPLSSCRWRAALGAGLPTPPLRWTAGLPRITGRPAVVQVRGREICAQRRPGVLRLDAALHSIETSTLRVEAARQSELTGGPRCWSHRHRHSKCMEGGVEPPHSRSPNCDLADFPRREPLAAVEPLGVSPLSSATTWQPHASPGHRPGSRSQQPRGSPNGAALFVVRHRRSGVSYPSNLGPPRWGFETGWFPLPRPMAWADMGTSRWD